MIEKKISNKTAKLKNFLVTGSVDKSEDPEFADEDYSEESYLPEGEVREGEFLFEEDAKIIEDVIDGETNEMPAVPEMSSSCAPLPEERSPAADGGAAERLSPETMQKIEQCGHERFDGLEAKIDSLASELGKYATTKEQLKEYTAVVNRRDTEMANRKFMGMLEQLSVMREDFFKLCSGMNAKLDSFSAKDVLSSFEAYGVDMENILIDCGVQIGPSEFEKLNTLNQRIVDVIPTDDETKNGMIAERMSDRYLYQGRILLKEKVKIYKYSGIEKAEGDEEK